MGRGRSGLGKSGGSGKSAAPTKANTPSGVSFNQFMKMSDSKKYDTMDRIIKDSSISVPAYLDKSDTSKVMYALGMNNKPTVVSDDVLDKMAGKDLYRTVYDTPNPPPYAQDVLDQIKTGDYTQMSNSGGSAHGRALYFAQGDFRGSASYGLRGNNSQVMRAKLNPNAVMMKESDLRNKMNADSDFTRKHGTGTDAIALYALSHGIDGWHADWGSYTMLINRGALTVSSKNKKAQSYVKTPTGRIKKSRGVPVTRVMGSWALSDDAN